MGRRTIHHQHDITGGMFAGLLTMHTGFALIALAVVGWLGFLAVQDWFSGRNLSPSEYVVDISSAEVERVGIEELRFSQTIRVENRSDVALTRVKLERRIFSCPAGITELAGCNREEQKPVYLNVQLAPGESTNVQEGGMVFVRGGDGNQTLRVQNRLLGVEGDEDAEI